MNSEFYSSEAPQQFSHPIFSLSQTRVFFLTSRLGSALRRGLRLGNLEIPYLSRLTYYIKKLQQNQFSYFGQMIYNFPLGTSILRIASVCAIEMKVLNKLNNFITKYIVYNIWNKSMLSFHLIYGWNTFPLLIIIIEHNFIVSNR